MDDLLNIFVYAPSLLFSGSGKKTPKWLRNAMIIGGAALLVYSINEYTTKQKNKLNGLNNCDKDCQCKSCNNLMIPPSNISQYNVNRG